MLLTLILDVTERGKKKTGTRHYDQVINEKQKSKTDWVDRMVYKNGEKMHLTQ